ncbi:hypothetical protein PGT21_030647 [Puccinia graminis f. sp. tritici]|uniref:Uncharacterized protein n=1 Tax=Puccinia graminis f. sp. tritici TaxID=56615 RepID=A0A5B0PLR7_PUCGR|nr:hypothetical protein PGT21_030647 [Puccinia graminis f. sp. tritici]
MYVRVLIHAFKGPVTIAFGNGASAGSELPESDGRFPVEQTSPTTLFTTMISVLSSADHTWLDGCCTTFNRACRFFDGDLTDTSVPPMYPTRDSAPLSPGCPYRAFQL